MADVKPEGPVKAKLIVGDSPRVAKGGHVPPATPAVKQRPATQPKKGK